MQYSKFFSSELKKLKEEGLYRKFREIDRPIKKFPKAAQVVIPGGNHRFESFEKYLPEIVEFAELKA